MTARAILALLLLACAAHAQDAAPLLLRMKVEQQGPVWVGQRVTVTVTAMTPVRFVDPIAWPDITAREGRIIVLPEAATVPGTERVGGESYAALVRSYSVFPATPGDLVLAPLTVRVRVGGGDGQPVAATASTEPARLSARVPPGVTDLRRLVVAPSFSLRAGTEGQITLHVGEAVTRTVRMQADGTAAMMLPPAIWPTPDGVRVYPDPPELQDHTDRGELRAVRNERASFVPQRAGDIELPGYAVSWLDPRQGQVRQVTVPPLRLHVLPAAEGPARARHLPWQAVAAAAAAVLAIAGGIWWLLRRHRHAATDALDELVAACRTGDPRRTLRALYRWADSTMPGGGERTLARLARAAGTPELDAEARRLEALLYGNGAGWDGEALIAAAQAADRTLRRHRGGPAGVGALPPLNPPPFPAPPPRLTQPRWAR